MRLANDKSMSDIHNPGTELISTVVLVISNCVNGNFECFLKYTIRCGLILYNREDVPIYLGLVAFKEYIETIMVSISILSY